MSMVHFPLGPNYILAFIPDTDYRHGQSVLSSALKERWRKSPSVYYPELINNETCQRILMKSLHNCITILSMLHIPFMIPVVMLQLAFSWKFEILTHFLSVIVCKLFNYQVNFSVHRFVNFHEKYFPGNSLEFSDAAVSN